MVLVHSELCNKRSAYCFVLGFIKYHPVVSTLPSNLLFLLVFSIKLIQLRQGRWSWVLRVYICESILWAMRKENLSSAYPILEPYFMFCYLLSIIQVIQTDLNLFRVISKPFTNLILLNLISAILDPFI